MPNAISTIIRPYSACKEEIMTKQEKEFIMKKTHEFMAEYDQLHVDNPRTECYYEDRITWVNSHLKAENICK